MGEGAYIIQYDWYPYKKRLGHRHTQREDHVKTQRENGHLQAKKSDSIQGINPANTLISNF